MMIDDGLIAFDDLIDDSLMTVINWTPVWKVRPVHAEVFFRRWAMHANNRPLDAEFNWVAKSERPVNAKK